MAMAEILEGGFKADKIPRDVTRNILDVLKSSEGMMTIQEIAASASVNRITAAKYLAILEARGMIRCRSIGRAKLYSIPKDYAAKK
jgi:predicted transcriptional regulator